MRLRELSAVRRRFGWRRLHVLLSREGVRVNHKKLRRLYIKERLQVCWRGGCKRALGTRAPMVLPQGPNQRWSLDFVSNALTDGRRFRILAMVDTTPGNACAWWPTHRCRAFGWCAAEVGDRATRHREIADIQPRRRHIDGD